MNDLNKFYNDYRLRKNEFYGAIKELEKKNILDYSDKQFKEFNQKLKLLPHSKRNIIIKNLIIRNIYFKLHSQGYNSDETKRLCKQILVNWNTLLMYDKDISVKELINNAKKCWERKEKKLKEEINNRNKKKKRLNKQLVGTFRLLASGGIVAYDSKMLIDNSGDSIFLSSFWISVMLFFQGVDNLFNL